jgi:hypothetical protein
MPEDITQVPEASRTALPEASVTFGTLLANAGPAAKANAAEHKSSFGNFFMLNSQE